MSSRFREQLAGSFYREMLAILEGAEPFPHSLSQGTLSTPYLKAPSISSKFGVATQLLDLAENFLYLVR